MVVVGAGPAGSTTAYELARRGRSVLLVEEHARVGHPVQCAGLVSQRVLDLAGAPNIVRRPVAGASVFSPSFRRLTFAAKEPKAFVIDRYGLDVALADRAARAGANVSTSTRFDGVAGPTPDGVRLRLTRHGEPVEVEARVVVGADGVASAVARAFRLRRPVEILPAYEVEFADSPGDPDAVEVFLGRSYAPGLFGWSIPDGDGGARVGVAVEAGPTSARSYCDRLVEAMRSRLGRPLRTATNVIASGIPIGRVPRTTGQRVVLVGDAAAQVKPLSGGGIYLGMRCAQIAAGVIDSVLASPEFRASSLAEYDRLWRAEFEDEIERALYLRRLFQRLSDPELERIVDLLDAASMTETIVAFGDIDFPSGVARRLFRQSPSLVRYFPKALSALWGAGGLRAPDLDEPVRRQA